MSNLRDFTGKDRRFSGSDSIRLPRGSTAERVTAQTGEIRLNTTFYTSDGGESWINSSVNPRGYRSCVYYSEGVYYACGRNGIDYSINNGKDWRPFADGTYFSMSSWDSKLIATTRYGKIVLFDLVEEKDKED